jgi:hypothetical protein
MKTLISAYAIVIIVIAMIVAGTSYGIIQPLHTLLNPTIDNGVWDNAPGGPADTSSQTAAK